MAVPPPPIAEPSAADLAHAAALGRALGAVPPVLAPLLQASSVALILGVAPRAGGVRTHPLGRALLAGMAEVGAGRDAVERARRAVERAVPVERVRRWLGPAAVGRLVVTLLGRLAREPAEVVRKLGKVLAKRALPVRTLRSLRDAVREAAPEHPFPIEPGPRPDTATAAALERAVARAEALASELCGEPMRVYLGPPDWREAPGFGAAIGAGPTPREADPSAVAEPTPEGSAEGSPPGVSPTRRRPEAARTPGAPPIPEFLRRLRASCRRLAPRLTPDLRERLLLPI